MQLCAAINRMASAEEKAAKAYLPEPDNLFAAACVVPVNSTSFPVIHIKFLHSTQHQLKAFNDTRTLNTVQKRTGCKWKCQIKENNDAFNE